MSEHGGNDAGKAHLETYLTQVQRYLSGLPDAEAREVIAELRSHVLDKVDGAPTPQRVEAAIAELGSPKEVARINVTERVVAHIETHRSPLSVLRGVVRLAGLSAYGFFAFLVSFTGYATAAAFLVTAAIKPFWREHAGLWLVPDPAGAWNFSLGVTTSPPQGRELLGWWIIPIGIALGLLLGWLTWRFGIFSMRRMRRSAQRGRA
ncbi:MAG: DUF1700 domain-containing protein [Phenylobacterium sp.]